MTAQIITNPGNKLKLDTLLKCEDVLKKLYEKVEGAPLACSTGGGGNSRGGNNRGRPAEPETPRSPSPPRPQPQVRYSIALMQLSRFPSMFQF